MKASESQLQTGFKSIRWMLVSTATIAVVTCTSALLSEQLSIANLAFLFLLPVIAVSGRYGLSRGFITAALSTLAFNFFLVPPRYTLHIADTDNVVTLAILLVVAFAVSNFAARLQAQAGSARQMAAESAALSNLTADLGKQTSECAMRQCLVDALSAETDCTVTVAEADELLGELVATSPIDLAAARWALAHGDAAGRGTQIMSSADNLFVASRIDGTRALLIQLWRADTLAPVSFARLPFIQTMADRCSEAIARFGISLARRTLEARAEQDEMREALLASFGHDMRTPLTTIKSGLAALKVEPGNSAALQAASEGADRLERLFSNLVDLARIRAGAISLRLEPIEIADSIASALDALKRQTADHEIIYDIPASVPLVRSDERLLHHILVNLIDNACKFSPPGGPIEITLEMSDDGLALIVRDAGPGLGNAKVRDVFLPFNRGIHTSSVPGTGLGLAIVAGYAKALGIDVQCGNRSEGNGAEFMIHFPTASLVSEM